MKRVIAERIIVFVLVVLLFCTVNALGEEKFPAKPMNVFIGFAPGGGATHTGTIICDGMKRYLGTPVTLNFKPGAAQAIAAEFIVNSPADGYTLFWVAFADLETKVAKDEANLRFGIDDLDNLGSACYTPYVLVVNKESPFKTVENLIAAARKTPGKVSHASSGYGALTHIAAEMFSQKTGIRMNHVPFTGGGPAIAALLGKHVDCGFASVGTYGGHIRPGGGLRPLIVFSETRDHNIPDVPTAKERGIEITLTSWFGLQARKGLPMEVRAKLIKAFKRTATDVLVVDQLTKLGFNMKYVSPEEVEKRVQKEYKQFVDIWQAIGK